MKPNTPYFAHDINARRDPKLLRLRARFGWSAVGVFWSLLELLHDVGGMVAEDDLDVYSVEFSPYTVDEFVSLVRSMLDLGLLVRDDRGRITHPRVMDTIERRERLSTAGRAGARNRWTPRPAANGSANGEDNTSANGAAISTPNTDKIRGDNIRGDKTEKIVPTSSETDESKPKRETAIVVPSGLRIPTVGKVAEFDVPLDLVIELELAFPNIDVRSQIERGRVWSVANPTRRKTARGVPRFLFQWMERATNGNTHSITKGKNGNSPEPRDLRDTENDDAKTRERWNLGRTP